MSYTYDGGVTWNTPIQIKGQDAQVTPENVFNALTNDQALFGCFYSEDGKLYFNASYLNTDLLDAKSGKIGGFNIGASSIYSGVTSMTDTSHNGVYIGTNGIHIRNNGVYFKIDNRGWGNYSNLAGYSTTTMYSMLYNGVYGTNIDGFHIQGYSGKPIYIGSLSNDGYNAYGARLVFTYNDVKVEGTQIATSAQTITSDIRKKHDVEDLDDRYIKLVEKLRPVRFKYNDGTSDRYHTGFIAQELEQALDECDIKQSESASIVTFRNITNDGLAEESKGIRYEELIAIMWAKLQKQEKVITTMQDKLQIKS